MAPVSIPRRGGAGERADIPLHFESVPLRPPVVAVGWPAAVVGAAGGIALAVIGQDSAAELVGAVLAAAAGVAMIGLVRCRRFDVVVGRKWLQGVAGPIRNRVPVALIEELKGRPATGWRRLYSDTELAIATGRGGSELAMPTRELPALLAAVGEVHPRTRGLSSGEETAETPSGRPG